MIGISVMKELRNGGGSHYDNISVEWQKGDIGAEHQDTTSIILTLYIIRNNSLGRQ